MKKLTLITTLFLGLGCTDHSDTHKHTTKETEGHEHHGHKDHSKHHSANEYMHTSSFEELIKRFESPERDAYQQPEKVLDHLGDLEGLTIMDIGAGTGYFSVKLAEKGANVIAADVNDQFQKYIEERIKENDLKNIETRKLAYDSPELNDQEVDMVLIVNTFHHIENRASYFEKVKKGTKADGSLVVIDFFKAEAPVGPPIDHKIAAEQVVEELREAGYSNFDVNVDLLNYQYIITAN